MSLISLQGDSSFARDSSGAIVNTNVADFNAAMQRKRAKEEYLSDLLNRVSENEEKVRYLTEMVEKLLNRKEDESN